MVDGLLEIGRAAALGIEDGEARDDGTILAGSTRFAGERLGTATGAGLRIQ